MEVEVEAEQSCMGNWLLLQMQGWAVNNGLPHKVTLVTEDDEVLGQRSTYYVEVEQLLTYLADVGGSVGGEPAPYLCPGCEERSRATRQAPLRQLAQSLGHHGGPSGRCGP